MVQSNKMLYRNGLPQKTSSNSKTFTCENLHVETGNQYKKILHIMLNWQRTSFTLFQHQASQVCNQSNS